MSTEQFQIPYTQQVNRALNEIQGRIAALSLAIISIAIEDPKRPGELAPIADLEKVRESFASIPNTLDQETWPEDVLEGARNASMGLESFMADVIQQVGDKGLDEGEDEPRSLLRKWRGTIFRHFTIEALKQVALND